MSLLYLSHHNINLSLWESSYPPLLQLYRGAACPSRGSAACSGSASVPTLSAAPPTSPPTSPCCSEQSHTPQDTDRYLSTWIYLHILQISTISAYIYKQHLLIISIDIYKQYLLLSTISTYIYTQYLLLFIIFSYISGHNTYWYLQYLLISTISTDIYNIYWYLQYLLTSTHKMYAYLDTISTIISTPDPDGG